MTSNQVLEIIRKITGIRKVGHAGTLDPLARGVLVVGIKREATRELDKIRKQEKEYIAEIKFGFESETDDEEGKKKKIEIKEVPSLEKIKKALFDFKGRIWQVPPKYSAVKIKGKEAYKLARKGIDVQIKPRKVLLKSIEIIKYRFPYLKIRIVCGTGFYVRALARDLGKKLGTGAYLKDLERIRVGDFKKKGAWKLKDFKRYYIVNFSNYEKDKKNSF